LFIAFFFSQINRPCFLGVYTVVKQKTWGNMHGVFMDAADQLVVGSLVSTSDVDGSGAVLRQQKLPDHFSTVISFNYVISVR
jgi:hypothetical protein